MLHLFIYAECVCVSVCTLNMIMAHRSFIMHVHLLPIINLRTNFCVDSLVLLLVLLFEFGFSRNSRVRFLFHFCKSILICVAHFLWRWPPRTAQKKKHNYKQFTSVSMVFFLSFFLSLRYINAALSEFGVITYIYM